MCTCLLDIQFTKLGRSKSAHSTCKITEPSPLSAIRELTIVLAIHYVNQAKEKYLHLPGRVVGTAVLPTEIHRLSRSAYRICK